MNVLETYDYILKNLTLMKPKDLETIRSLVEKNKTDFYDQEVFMHHKQRDEYIYTLYFKNGTKKICFTGQEAYYLYISDSAADRIVRKPFKLNPEPDILLLQK